MSSLDDDLSWWVFRDRRHQRMPWIEMKTFSVDFFFLFVFGPLVKVDRGKCLSLFNYILSSYIPGHFVFRVMMNHDPLALSTPVKNVPTKIFWRVEPKNVILTLDAL